MNPHDIETLARAASHLLNSSIHSKSSQVCDQILDRISAELTQVSTSDELNAALASSNIKQANINLLAGKILDFEKMILNCEAWGGYLQNLAKLAESLRQEETNTTVDVVN